LAPTPLFGGSGDAKMRLSQNFDMTGLSSNAALV
jgi:hypothetical protein